MSTVSNESSSVILYTDEEISAATLSEPRAYEGCSLYRGEIILQHGTFIIGHGGGPRTNQRLIEFAEAYRWGGMTSKGKSYERKSWGIISCGFNTLDSYYKKKHVQRWIGIPQGEGEFIVISIKDVSKEHPAYISKYAYELTSFWS